MSSLHCRIMPILQDLMLNTRDNLYNLTSQSYLYILNIRLYELYRDCVFKRNKKFISRLYPGFNYNVPQIRKT